MGGLAVAAGCSGSPASAGSADAAGDTRAPADSSGDGADGPTTIATEAADTGAGSADASASSPATQADDGADSGSPTSTTGDSGGAPLWDATCSLPGGGAGGVWGDCYEAWPGTCSIQAQNCGAGAKCTYYLADGPLGPKWAARCADVVDDPRASGESCSTDGLFTGNDDCDADTFCVGMTPDSWSGTCTERAQCGEACDTPGTTPMRSGAPAFCGYYCDPFLGGAACPAGFQCQPPGGSYTDYFVSDYWMCLPDVTWLSADGSCEGGCVSGEICFQPDVAKLEPQKCVSLCTTDGDPATCIGNEVCVGWGEVVSPWCTNEALGRCVHT